ncbi:hypothetical protein BDN72DRAFT_897468 [Pluteus cervinus]|uniref:Uncharacterized protein n=1 Tax=Pluteus cervinus TaxID=181527 RepID=A0ACD3ATW9_9AGAR|nr:hypothetical protein BDN72DRAFT_897468 [Pluteus cervinus]
MNQYSPAALRLPREVLSEIFTLSAPSFDLQALDSLYPSSWDLETSNLDPMYTPWTLGQICRYWRDVSISEQRLWTTVVTFIAESDIPDDHSEWLLKEWLKRSGNHALDIVFYAPSALWDTSRDQGIQAILRTLAQHSLRWKSARIAVDETLIGALSSVLKRLPILENVRLDLLRDPDDLLYNTRPPCNFFQFAPKLLHITFSGPLSIMRFPWSQLQSFSGPPACLTMHCVLGRCPKLKTYDVTGGYSMAPVEMTLRHLHLRNIFACWTPGLFEFLELPALEVLSLHSIDPRSFPVLTSFFQRSRCSLSRLDLSNLALEGVNPNATKEFIASFPTLGSLAISMFGVTSHNTEVLLSSLIIQETLTSSNIPLPKLETLSLVYERYEHEDIRDDQRAQYPDLGPMDLQRTITVLRSRLYLSPDHRRVAKPLDAVSISTNFPITQEEHSYLDDMHLDGMTITTKIIPPFTPDF